MQKRLVPLIAAAAVLLSVSGATAMPLGPSTKQHAQASGSVTVAVGTDPGSLDPQLTILASARFVDSFAYDTLVSLTGPGKIASALAQSWKVVSPKRVEFTLHSGITCSDGSKMTASVVKRNLDFVGNPANKSPLLGVFMPLGATVTADDKARTVVVTTTRPNPFMIQGLASVQLVCSAGLSDRAKLTRGAIGSGPYTLVSAVPGDHYTFQVRKGYKWGPGGATTSPSGLPAKVTIKVVSNETTAANLLLTGGVNLATLAGPDRKRLDKAKGLFHKVLPGPPAELFFNENQGHPAASATVRRALVQALNTKQIGTVATGGLGVPVTQLSLQSFTPCAGDSVTGNLPAFNPGAARSALNGVTVKLLYPTDGGSTWIPAAELAQQQLSAAGAKVTLDGQSTAALQGKLFGTGDWDVVLIAIGVANPSQITGFLSGPASPKGTNFGNVDNAAYKAAVSRAQRRVGTQGCKYWLDAERALFKAADLAPMAVFTNASYGKGVSFALGVQGPVPTSLRLT